ncbi:MAG: cytochrome c-type biogenesis protein [Chloroflexota bacterium]
MMKRNSFFQFCLMIALLLVTAVTVQAQDSVTDDEVNDVAKGLYCPVCESTPLDVCPTQACADWRELIREQLASGMTKQEIYNDFAFNYGDGVLAEPPRQGFSLILWLTPILAIGVGGVIFFRLMQQFRSASPTPAPVPVVIKQADPTPAQSNVALDIDDFVSRIETELQELSNG